VAIGPVTAVALRDAGLRNIVQAADTTVASVIEALETFFAPPRSCIGRGFRPASERLRARALFGFDFLSNRARPALN